MRILLDNCVDRKYGRLLIGHEVVHASRMGWSLLENGDLIATAEAAGFETMITVDKNLRYQQNLKARKISIITLAPRLVFFRFLEPLAERVLEALIELPPGSFLTIAPEE